MRFRVLEPASVADALSLLNNESSTSVIAGGTDILVKIKRGLIRPACLLSLHNIPELRRLAYEPGKGLVIGALVTHAQVAAHPAIREKYPVLAQACLAVGSPQIRSLGTLAGNLANASPAADGATALLALNAKVVIGNRVDSIALEDFFLGPGKNVLTRGELITQILVPEPLPGTRGVYLKLGKRKALEIAICSAALVATEEYGVWSKVNLALGAVGPTPFLAADAAVLLEKQVLSSSACNFAAHRAAQDCMPIDDHRASAEYRRYMVEVLFKRAVCALRCGEG